jgi:Zn-dependent oligopeptidase
VLHDYCTVTAADVESDVAQGLAALDARVDALVASPPSTVLEVARVLDAVQAEANDIVGRAAFAGWVHPDAGVREAGQKAYSRLSAWRGRLTLRDDVAALFLGRDEAPGAEPADPVDARLVAHWERDLRRSGHGLPSVTRERVRELRDRLAEIEAQWDVNIAEDTTGLDLIRDELDGLPDSFVEGLQPGAAAGTYAVTLDYPQLNPFLAQATRRDKREALFKRSRNRGVGANRALVDEGLAVRRELATLLGYRTWADYQTEVKMAGTPGRAHALLDRLGQALLDPVAVENAELRALLVEDGEPDDVRLEQWDLEYTRRIRAERRVGLDPSALAEYFAVPVVLETAFELLGDLLGLSFPAAPAEDSATVWHDDVVLREIRDLDGTLLGRVYLDLYPRDGKFSHAAAFDLVRSRHADDGSRVPALAALVTNFSPPRGDRPGLLRHDEMVTLFHELGHVVHQTVTQSRYVRFAGTATEGDFVEAPSQLMERWAWEPAVIERAARHWSTGEPLPPELVRRLTESRFLGSLGRTSRGLWLSRLDLAVHESPDEVDLEAAMRSTNDVLQLPYPEDTFMLAAFGHLFGGYDAGYYGYLWAEVIGDDMVGRFEQEGILSPAVGREFRTSVLERGGTLDGDDLVRAFLDRDADPESFLRARGWA